MKPSPWPMPVKNETFRPDATIICAFAGRITVQARQRIFELDDGIMDERRPKPFHHAVADHSLVDDRIVEAALCRAETAARRSRDTSRNGASAGRKSWRDAETPKRPRRRGDGGFDRRGKLRRDAFIGIERQHPRPGRERQRIVFLRAKALPFVKLGARPFSRAISTVASVLPQSTTIRSSQKARLSRHAPIFAASFGDHDGAELRHEASVLRPLTSAARARRRSRATDRRRAASPRASTTKMLPP